MCTGSGKCKQANLRQQKVAHSLEQAHWLQLPRYVEDSAVFACDRTRATHMMMADQLVWPALCLLMDLITLFAKKGKENKERSETFAQVCFSLPSKGCACCC